MSGRKPLTPIGTDLESIIIAVVLFMTCGILMFICCFIVTQVYLRYKHGCLKKNRRGAIQFASLKADPEFR